MATRAVRDGDDDLWVEFGPDRFYCLKIETDDPREADFTFSLEGILRAQGLVPATEQEIFLETDGVRFV
jgi:hypothetical protein